MSPTIAAVDIGTNSIHLVIARPREDGGFDILATEKDPVRLGRGGADFEELSDDAMERGIAVLDRYRQLAAAHDAQIAAVATSALREASNRREFIARAAAEAGIDIDVISGTEEARLIFLGAQQSLPLADRRALVVDIGGGSTELIVGEGTRIEASRSLKLGAIRLTDRFFPDGTVDPDRVPEARAFLRAYLSPAVSAMAELPRDMAVGCSGTILTLAAMHEAREGRSPQTLNGVTLDRDALVDIEADLLGATVAQREKLDGMDPKRADIIPAGAMLLRSVFEVFDLDEMVMSTNALREGVVFDRARPIPAKFHHLSDPRRQSVLGLAAAFDEDLDHVTRATDLALRLFDDLEDLHGLSTSARDVLEAAALLHNVGLYISHSAHHKHSYYVIRHSDRLAGFSDHEIELIALVARYHRRREPRNKHAEFAALSSDDQAAVRVLAGLLRIGIALDRTRRHAIIDLNATAEKKSIRVDLEVEPGADTSLERYMADERKALLEHALERPITFSADDAAVEPSAP